MNYKLTTCPKAHPTIVLSLTKISPSYVLCTSYFCLSCNQQLGKLHISEELKQAYGHGLAANNPPRPCSPSAEQDHEIPRQDVDEDARIMPSFSIFQGSSNFCGPRQSRGGYLKEIICMFGVGKGVENAASLSLSLVMTCYANFLFWGNSLRFRFL